MRMQLYKYTIVKVCKATHSSMQEFVGNTSDL